ncbi:hypothetical protein QAD02_008263 [Eretmocerus hayati]|uniref:Uncharacterized protein n=1 Tax=Eretmocerus hayati TaxID=131215 RepID=A0ACC2N6T3_9HYME|nr:hypothetical protein QAD02_008263 [Eretmocerus hayati]
MRRSALRSTDRAQVIVKMNTRSSRGHSWHSDGASSVARTQDSLRQAPRRNAALYADMRAEQIDYSGEPAVLSHEPIDATTARSKSGPKSADCGPSAGDCRFMVSTRSDSGLDTPCT